MKKKQTKEPKTDWRQKAVEELRAFRNLGETFNYLGREIVVTGHYDYSFSLHHCVLIPELRGDYVDDKGKIHKIKFGYRELETLKKQNPSNAALSGGEAVRSKGIVGNLNGGDK